MYSKLNTDFGVSMKLTFLFVIIALLFSACSTTSLQTPSPTPTAEPQAQGTESLSVLAGENALYIADQVPGKEVLINTVVLQKPGYVVIHKADESGQPGEVIGNSSLLNPSDISTTIDLKEDIASGEVYFAMLHTDDGDGVFSFPGSDSPVTDNQGQVVMMQFKADPNADPQVDVMM